MEWSYLFGFGIGLVAGFFCACMIGLAKEADRQAEIDYWRMVATDREGLGKGSA
jgi:hypothetical protein